MTSFFDHPYYKWNKIFLSFLGIWPEQSLFMRCLMPFLVWVILMSVMIPEVIRVRQIWGDVDSFMECIAPLFTLTMSFTQLFNGCFNRKKISEMLDRISADWKRHGESANIEIIHKYASRGCSITKSYSGFMYSSGIFYLVMPIFPIILDFIVPLNESRQRNFLFEAEYGVNSDDYYWSILAHGCLTAVISVVAIISNDVMFFAMVEHGCGLFEIVRMNLEMVHTNENNRGDRVNDNGYRMICHCVSLHREALIFAELVESCYTLSFMGVMFCSLLMLSISGVQTIMHLDDLPSTLRYGSFSLAQIVHLYFNSVPGQKMMDYSLSIFDYAYAVNWHALTPRAQKLLTMIMLKSMRPCQITAGKVYILSMESYSSVMQTSMSYFTVLLSMR